MKKLILGNTKDILEIMNNLAMYKKINIRINKETKGEFIVNKIVKYLDDKILVKETNIPNGIIKGTYIIGFDNFIICKIGNILGYELKHKIDYIFNINEINLELESIDSY